MTSVAGLRLLDRQGNHTLRFPKQISRSKEAHSGYGGGATRSPFSPAHHRHLGNTGWIERKIQVKMLCLLCWEWMLRQTAEDTGTFPSNDKGHWSPPSCFGGGFHQVLGYVATAKLRGGSPKTEDGLPGRHCHVIILWPYAQSSQKLTWALQRPCQGCWCKSRGPQGLWLPAPMRGSVQSEQHSPLESIPTTPCNKSVRVASRTPRGAVVVCELRGKGWQLFHFLVLRQSSCTGTVNSLGSVASPGGWTSFFSLREGWCTYFLPVLIDLIERGRLSRELTVLERTVNNIMISRSTHARALPGTCLFGILLPWVTLVTSRISAPSQGGARATEPSPSRGNRSFIRPPPRSCSAIKDKGRGLAREH